MKPTNRIINYGHLGTTEIRGNKTFNSIYDLLKMRRIVYSTIEELNNPVEIHLDIPIVIDTSINKQIKTNTIMFGGRRICYKVELSDGSVLDVPEDQELLWCTDTVNQWKNIHSFAKLKDQLMKITMLQKLEYVTITKITKIGLKPVWKLKFPLNSYRLVNTGIITR